MPSASLRNELCRILRFANKNNAVKEVIVADCSLPPTPHAIATPQLRMHLVTDGSRRMRISQNGQQVDTVLKAGSLIVAPPHAGTEPLYPIDCVNIGIGFKAACLRLITQRKRKRRSRDDSADKIVYHTHTGLRPVGQHCQQALEAAAADAAPQNILRPLALALLRQVYQQVIHDEAGAHSQGHYQFQRAMDYLEEHAHRDIGRNDIAAVLDIHPNHLSRIFKEHAGLSFSQTLTRRRLELACSLLLQSELEIQAVAKACGFGDCGHFIRQFRKYYNTSPGRYRMQQR